MSAAADPTQRRQRILVAEDDTLMRQVVVDVLRKESYEVEEFCDGQQLLTRIAHAYISPTDAWFDLLVTDVRMPFFSGLDVLQHIRRTAGVQKPVLMMTAFGDRDLRVRVTDLGAMLLDKPFAPQALRDAVRDALARPPAY